MLLGEKDRAKWKRQEMSGKRDGERVSLSLKEKERGKEREVERERGGVRRDALNALSVQFSLPSVSIFSPSQIYPLEREKSKEEEIGLEC